MPQKKINIETFPDSVYAQNSRILQIDGHQECWLIDPGFPPSTKNMLKFLLENKLTPTGILLTHAHTDHIAGITEILAHHANLAIFLAKVEWAFLSDPSQNLSSWGGQSLSIQAANLHDLSQGDALQLADSTWQILDTSGHSPGGRSFYCPDHGVAIVGDALFAGSVGRTDFPHSDARQLFRNIREKLLTLPGDTVVYTGHGPETTIETERLTNPFLTESTS